MNMLIDSHCHLQFPQFQDDRVQVLERAWQAGLSALVLVGTDADCSQRALALAESHPNLFATVGWHPHQAAQFDDQGRLAVRLRHGEQLDPMPVDEFTVHVNADVAATRQV